MFSFHNVSFGYLLHVQIQKQDRNFLLKISLGFFYGHLLYFMGGWFCFWLFFFQLWSYFLFC